MKDSSNPCSEITFVRHGESVGNLENRLQGRLDYPLSETGRAQAGALAQHWNAAGKRFDVAIASPLSRASETADILARALQIPQLEFEPLWMERDMGKRSGLTMSEIKETFHEPGFVNPYGPAYDSGESDWELYLRAGQALHKILQRPASRYLVVTHGAILQMTLLAILGLTPHANSQGPHFTLENTCVCSFRYYPGMHLWRVDAIGERSHWPVGQPQSGAARPQADTVRDH